MKTLHSYLFSELKQINTIAVFKKALFVFLLYKVLLFGIWFQSFFGTNNLVYHPSQTMSDVKGLVFLLNTYNNVFLNLAAIILLAVIAMAGLFNYSRVYSNILLFLLVSNINNYIYPTLTAGDFLLNQLLFFNIFLFTAPARNPVLKDIQYALHNTALLGIKLQICVVYLMAAYYKLCDTDWLHGDAVYQALQINAFTSSPLKSLPHGLYVLMNYFTLIYQLLFSLVVWIKPLKKYVLAIGILQHLFIAFGMGLFGFGIIMIISYIIFLDFDKKL